MAQIGHDFSVVWFFIFVEWKAASDDPSSGIPKPKILELYALLFVICISLSCYICIYICISLSCWLHLHFSFVLVVVASTYICISLSAFLFRVGGHLHFSFVLVDICTSLSCRWTSALIFRVGGHLHFSFVLATSALIFRVDCKYLHPHFSSADVTRATENTSPASKPGLAKCPPGSATDTTKFWYLTAT